MYFKSISHVHALRLLLYLLIRQRPIPMGVLMNMVHSDIAIQSYAVWAVSLYIYLVIFRYKRRADQTLHLTLLIQNIRNMVVGTGTGSFSFRGKEKSRVGCMR